MVPLRGNEDLAAPRRACATGSASESNGGGRDPATDNPRVAQALAEYVAALDAGEPVDREQFLCGHAAIAEQLVECLEGLEFIHGAAAKVHELDEDATRANPLDELQAPFALGDYKILREIGRGGMGVVYEAEQLSLSRRVALKVLPFAAILDPRHLQRFKNEAIAAAQLAHPHIVDVHGVGCDRGIHFYAMRLIEGDSLAAVIDGLKDEVQSTKDEDSRSHAPRGNEGRAAPRRGDDVAGTLRVPSPHTECAAYNDTVAAALSTLRTTRPRDFFRRVAELGIQAAEALDHAHQMGIVHRDIKPSNLMLDHLGRLWVTDFGLARVQSEPGMTMTGDLLGTLRYMSPEQAAGGKVVDERTDIYSLGLTLYELITLRPAFVADDRQTLLRLIAEVQPIAPYSLNRAIPIDLETVMFKALAKDARDRYATAGEFAKDLRRFVAGEPIRAKRPTVMQRAAKWSRRHPGALVSSTLVFLVACLAALVAAGIANVERAKTAEALKAKGRAFTRAHEDLGIAVSAVDDMYTDLATSWIANETAPTTMQEKFLQRAIHFYDQIVARTPTTDNERILAAQIYGRLGLIQQYLGNPGQAAVALRESIAIAEDVAAMQPDRDEFERSLPERYRALAEALIETADSAAAEEASRAGLAYLDRFAQREPSSVEMLEELVLSYHSQAALCIRTDQLDRAEKLIRSATERIAALWRLKAIPRFLEPQNGFLLARIMLIKGDHAAARKQARQALDSCRRLRVQKYRDARPPIELETDILELLGEISESEGALAQAAEHYRQALDLQRSAFKARCEPADFIVQTHLLRQDYEDGQFEHGPFCRYIETQFRLARVLSRLGRWDEAEHILGECTLAAPVIWALRENGLRYHVAEANAWVMAAELLANVRPAESEPARQHAILIWQHILAWFPGAAAYRSGVHGAINDLDWFRGRLPAAVAHSLSPRDVSGSVRLTRPEISFTKNARERSWKDAEQSGESRKIDRAGAWLHLVMSHSLLGDKVEALRWFDKANDAIQSIETPHEELTMLRDQAEQYIRERALESHP